MKIYVYVDYENMNIAKSFPKIDGKYFFFIGANQTKIPATLAMASNESNVEFIQVEGTGKNALDFYIAYYLAKNDSEKDVVHCIWSKDKGFDPLINFINKTKKSKIAKRIVNINEVQKKTAEVKSNKKQQKTKLNENIQDKTKKTIDKLKTIAASKRPKSEKALKAYIQTFSAKDKWTIVDIDNIMNELHKKGIIKKEKNNKITYSLY